MNTENLYRQNIDLLQSAGIEYREFEHEPVLCYEKAAQIRQRFNLSGVESKSLFLKLKDDRYCMFISLEGKRFDPKRLRVLLGSKSKVCSDQELNEETGCVPKCACPFGHSAEVTLIIDNEIFQHERFIYSPGPPEKTIEIKTEDIQEILNCSPNKVFYYQD
ncbi:MAG: YbaK/EbsC family protein [Anaerolineales bacterium]